MSSGEVIDLALEGFESADVFYGGTGGGWRSGGVEIASWVLTSGWNLAFDVLQGVTPFGVEVGMTECPTLWRRCEMR